MVNILAQVNTECIEFLLKTDRLPVSSTYAVMCTTPTYSRLTDCQSALPTPSCALHLLSVL